MVDWTCEMISRATNGGWMFSFLRLTPCQNRQQRWHLHRGSKQRHSRTRRGQVGKDPRREPPLRLRRMQVRDSPNAKARAAPQRQTGLDRQHVLRRGSRWNEGRSCVYDPSMLSSSIWLIAAGYISCLHGFQRRDQQPDAPGRRPIRSAADLLQRSVSRSCVKPTARVRWDFFLLIERTQLRTRRPSGSLATILRRTLQIPCRNRPLQRSRSVLS